MSRFESHFHPDMTAATWRRYARLVAVASCTMNTFRVRRLSDYTLEALVDVVGFIDSGVPNVSGNALVTKVVDAAKRD